MSIKISKNKSLTIFDGTLPEVFKKTEKSSKGEANSICRGLIGSDFDFIEINSNILKEVKRLPAGVNYLFRIRNMDDARVCIENSIKYCCIDEIVSYDLDLLAELYDNGIDVMVDIKPDRMKDIKNLISIECKSLFIKSIRIS